MKIQNGISLVPPTAEEKAKQIDGHLRDASQMYENYFLNEMVRAMRSTVPREGGITKPNFAEKIFEQQLDQQYVDGWAKKGGIGLADMIYSQLSDKVQASHAGKSFPIKGALPIAPKQEPIGIPSDSIQMKTIPSAEPQSRLEYRFEVSAPAVAKHEVQAPLGGKITETQTLGEGWNMVRLDHGQGLRSELTFPGQMAETGIGSLVEGGQKLGDLETGRPVLAWKLDWT